MGSAMNIRNPSILQVSGDLVGGITGKWNICENGFAGRKEVRPRIAEKFDGGATQSCESPAMIPGDNGTRPREHCRQRQPAGEADRPPPSGDFFMQTFAMKPHMEFFVGKNLFADDFQHGGPAADSNDAIVFQGNDLGHQQDRNLFVKTQQMTTSSKKRVRPVPPQERDIHLVKNAGEKTGMLLFLSDKHRDGLTICLVARLAGKLTGGRQQSHPVRTFAQLKSRERAGQGFAQLWI